jgi:hypothetical protein
MYNPHNYNSNMKRQPTLVVKYYRWRSNFYKRQRLLYPSPAEVRLIRLMGGRVLSLPFIRHPQTGFPMAKVLSMGKVFNRELVQREVRVGSKYVDFGNDLKRGIEVDGQEYHKDIVVQVERDEYFARYGWRVLHIPARDLWLHADKVYWQVLDFLCS